MRLLSPRKEDLTRGTKLQSREGCHEIARKEKDGCSPTSRSRPPQFPSRSFVSKVPVTTPCSPRRVGPREDGRRGPKEADERTEWTSVVTPPRPPALTNVASGRTVTTVALSSESGWSEDAGEADGGGRYSQPSCRGLLHSSDWDTIDERSSSLHPYRRSGANASAPVKGSDVLEFGVPGDEPQQHTAYDEWGKLWGSSELNEKQENVSPSVTYTRHVGGLRENDVGANSPPADRRHLEHTDTHRSRQMELPVNHHDFAESDISYEAEKSFHNHVNEQDNPVDFGPNRDFEDEDYSLRAEQSFRSLASEQEHPMLDSLEQRMSTNILDDKDNGSVSSEDWSAAVTKGSLSTRRECAGTVSGSRVVSSSPALPKKEAIIRTSKSRPKSEYTSINRGEWELCKNNLESKDVKSDNSFCSDLQSGIATQGTRSEACPVVKNKIPSPAIPRHKQSVKKDMQDHKLEAEINGVLKLESCGDWEDRAPKQRPTSIVVRESSKRTIMSVSDMGDSVVTSWKKDKTAGAGGTQEPKNQGDMPKNIHVPSKECCANSDLRNGHLSKASSQVSVISGIAGSTVASQGEGDVCVATLEDEKKPLPVDTAHSKWERNQQLSRDWTQSIKAQNGAKKQHQRSTHAKKASKSALVTQVEQSVDASAEIPKSNVSWADGIHDEDNCEMVSAAKYSRLAYENEWKEVMKKGIPEAGESSSLSQASHMDGTEKSGTSLSMNYSGKGDPDLHAAHPEPGSFKESKSIFFSQPTKECTNTVSGKSACPHPDELLRHFKVALKQDEEEERNVDFAAQGGLFKPSYHSPYKAFTELSLKKEHQNYATLNDMNKIQANSGNIRRRPRWGRKGRQESQQPTVLVCDSMSQVSGISDMVDSTATSWKERQSLSSKR